MTRPLIYVSGPITLGCQATNVGTAIAVGRQIWDVGGAPFIPHLSWFLHWHDLTIEDWLSIDFQIIPNCKAMFRIPGESKGSDAECELAKSRGIPIFHDIEELRLWISKHASDK